MKAVERQEVKALEKLVREREAYEAEQAARAEREALATQQLWEGQQDAPISVTINADLGRVKGDRRRGEPLRSVSPANGTTPTHRKGAASQKKVAEQGRPAALKVSRLESQGTADKLSRGSATPTIFSAKGSTKGSSKVLVQRKTKAA